MSIGVKRLTEWVPVCVLRYPEQPERRVRELEGVLEHGAVEHVRQHPLPALGVHRGPGPGLVAVILERAQPLYVLALVVAVPADGGGLEAVVDEERSEGSPLSIGVWLYLFYHCGCGCVAVIAVSLKKRCL